MLTSFASTSGRCGCSPALHQRVTAAAPRCRPVKAGAVAKSQPEVEVLDLSYDVVARNQSLFRSLPLWAGGLGIAALLTNRAVSGIAPVVDASSSQSRADVLAIIMASVLLLTGLQWLSLKPRVVSAVELDGVQVNWVDPDSRLPASVVDELQWAWTALSSSTRCKSLVLILEGRTVFHAGLILRGARPGAARAGSVCTTCMTSGQGNYLANLVLYPGRLEFTSFLPENTQGVAVQPLGQRGVLIAGIDTVRGLGRMDQAWLAAIADKLEVSLESVSLPVPGGVGFGAGKADVLKTGARKGA